MKRNAVFASLVTLLVAVSAHAVTYDVKLAFDIDRKASTGCTVITSAGTFNGAEQVVNTRVDVTGGTATTFAVTRQACSGGVIGSALSVDPSSWPAGLTTTGNLFIETHVTPAEIGLATVGPVRMAFFVTNGTLFDSVTATGTGNPLLWPQPGRHRAVNPTPLPPRTIILDGNDSDWNGIPPVAGGGSGTSDMRILNGYAFGTLNQLFFAVRLQANHNAPTAAPDSYALETVGGTLNVGAGSGVLANDSDPNSLPLSAVLIAGTQHGVLTLNGNGSFTYANDGSSAPVDTFEYKATNGTLDSNVAQVQIGIGAGSGPTPPPAPKFTSPDHATFNAGQFNTFLVTTTPLHPSQTITGGIGLPAGVTVVDNHNSTATISGVPNIGSGGVYVTNLHAHNVVGDADQLFTLTVNDAATAPSITSNPTSQTVCNGGTATFTASASGLPGPTVQWQVSTNGGSSFSNVAGATNTTYSFVANSAQSGNQYRAVFTNVMGSATTTAATLTVTTPPVVTTHPLPQTVCAGAMATFTAAATPATVTVQWQVSSSGPGGPFSDVPGATSTTLSFVTTAADNGKHFRAVFTNACGTVPSNAALLTVNSTPTPTITPTPAQVCANSTGNSAAGPAGMTTYAWSIVNGAITSATNIQTITYTAGASGTVNLTLVVTNITGCPASNTANVTINANPATPTITPTPAAVCANTTGNTASGPAGATTYAWSIVNGAITSATNIQTITYTAGASGTVDLTLVVTNAASCSATNTVNVPINPNPTTPTITPTPAQVCANSTGNSAAGPAGATTYAWSIVNGTITSAANIQTITYTAGASGTVDLTLVVGNAPGCTASNTVNVPINANPATPTITPTPAQVCANSTGNTATGPAGATTYAWSIVNGTITSATNIQAITYTAGTAGTTDLTLVVTNASGCSASNTVNVTVNANPATPTITPSPAQVCANSAGNTAQGPAGATTYAWSAVNGTITSATNIQTITYTAGASGTVDLTLVVTNASGCSATNTVNVTINANPTTPTITPTPAQVCANSTGNSAAGPAGATTYAWSAVNGTITSAANIQTITYTAGASGTVDLTLVVTNAAGCSATNTVNVTINANPATPTITPTPAQVCANSAGNTATGPAGATTYAWSIVNGSITSATNTQAITYTAGASGTVDLTLVVTNAAGCSASNTVNVTINPSPATPTITPTPAQVCANSTGNSAAGPAGATTYAWSIVNGTITSATNIQTITYDAGASGTVDLTLVVTNGSGCPASNTVNVTINANPATPTITPSPAQVCANSAGNTADGPAGATTYAWSIVNGSITSATNIQTITYNAGASGTVDLTLVVTNAAGCSASNTVNVTINANPSTPTITPTPAQVCANSTGNSADGPAGATTYAWSIVNGSITSATNIQTITYTAGASGTVDLTLVVTNAAGCSASNTVNVTINPSPATPTITPTPAQVCANSTGNSAAGPAGATTYAWSIVNGTITSATNIQTITYTAGASGTVDLTLVVTNGSGCPASNTVNVTINANPATPTITPTPAQVCANSTGNSADGPVGATTYAWSIVNGSITSATNIQTITYTAGASGTVDLTLVVTNAAGCSASNTVNVTINANPATPTITPTPAQVCANSTGNSADGPAGATTYAWSIVNGSITSAANIQTITYTAGASGTVDLTLVVTNAAGCSASNTVNVTINANPATPTITPTPAQVCANSTGNSAAGPAGATTYAWSIVNGSITSATNIQTITYTAGASGTVDLTLVVTNAAGCSASNTVNVTINPNPSTPSITPTPAQVCANSTGNSADGPAGATTYAWSIVNGSITSATNIQTITYTAGASGTVDLTLVVTNGFGCSASNTVNVTINPNPSTPTITPTPAALCPSSTGNSAAGPAGATTYAWSIVNGSITSATNIQTITYDAGLSGTVDLTLVVTNGFGCSASNTVNVPISNSPPVVTTHPLTQSVQSGSSVTFTAAASGTPAPTVQWELSTDGGTVWNPIGGATSTSLTFTAQLSQNGYQYRAVFTNTCGTATTNVATLTVTCPTITVQKTPPGSFPTGVLNLAYPAAQNVGASGGTAPYTFVVASGSLPPGLTLASGGNISGTPTNPNTGTFTFTVTATDANGCQGTSATLTIKVAPAVQDDTFNGVGNTQFLGLNATIPTTPHLYSSTNILANDTGPGLAVNPVTDANTVQGGKITLLADGSFDYRPPAGFTGGTDQYTYSVSSNGVSSASNIIFNLTGKVWYVKNNYGAAGTGLSNDPFQKLAGVAPSAENSSAAGDTIYVSTGDGTTLNQNAGITLKATQTLFGAGITTFTVGAITITTPGAGTKPLIGNLAGAAVTLANGNTLTGFTATTTVLAAQAGITGNALTTGPTIDTVNVGPTTGAGINITASGTITTSLTTVAITGAGTIGINANTFGTLTIGANVSVAGVSALALNTGAVNGTFTSVGSTGGTNGVSLTAITGTFGTSAGTLTGATGPTFLVSNGTFTSTWQGSITQANNAALLSVTGHGTGTITFNTGTLSSTNGTGLQFSGATGTYNFNGATTLNGGTAGIGIAAGSNGTFVFGTGVLIGNTASPAGTAFSVNASTPGVTYSGNITQTTGNDTVNITTQASGTITFQTGTLTVTSGNGIVLSNADGTVNFNGTTNVSGAANGVRIVAGTGGTITFSANTAITSTGTPFTLDGSGLNGPAINGNITYNGTINKAGSGTLLSINTLSGSLAFNGATLAGATNAGPGIVSTVANITGTLTANHLSLDSSNANFGPATLLLINGTNTAGTMTFNHLVLSANGANAQGVGINASGGGTLNVTNTGGNSSITTRNASALILANNALGMNFGGGITVGGGAAAASGVSLTTTTGSVTITGGSIAGMAGAAFLVSGGTVSVTDSGTITQATAAQAAVSVSGGHNTGTLTFTGAVTATNGTGLQFDNADGTYNFNSATNALSGGARVDILNGSSGTFSFVAGMTITNGGGTASVNVSGSAPNLTYSGTITTNVNRPVSVSNGAAASCGTILFQTGNITATAGSNGILVNNCNAGTVTFTNPTISLTTTTNAGVTLTNAGTALVDFSPAAGGNGLDVLTTTGKAFTATGGGNVKVTGSGNTLSTNTAGTGNTVLEVDTVTIASGGLNFVSISGNGNSTITRGIYIKSAGGNGLFVTGVAAAGSGGTLQNYTQKGVFIDTANNINLSRMNLTGNGTVNLGTAATCGDEANGTNTGTNCAAGIDLQSVTTVNLTTVNVTGGVQIGINGKTVSGLTFNTVTVSGAGNEALEDGVQFADLTGTNSFTTVNFNNNASRQLAVQNGSGTGTLNITTSSFSNTAYPTLVTTPSSTTAAQGILYSGHGSANMTLNVQNSTFTKNFAAAVFSDTQATAVMNFTVNGGSITDNGLAIQVAGTGSGAMTYALTSVNPITTDPAHAITGPISFFRGGVATGTWNGTITGNTIGTTGVAFSGSPCTSCVGMIIENSSSGPGTHNVTISGNIIKQTGHTAIHVATSGSGSGDVGAMNAKILNNNISEPAQAGDSAIMVLAGDSVSGDTSNVCADVSGNTITNGANAWNAAAFIAMNERFTNVLRLPGFGGGTGATAAAFVSGQNSGVATNIQDGTDNFIGGGAACF